MGSVESQTEEQVIARKILRSTRLFPWQNTARSSGALCPKSRNGAAAYFIGERLIGCGRRADAPEVCGSTRKTAGSVRLRPRGGHARGAP
jgi:hypothetical protein